MEGPVKGKQFKMNGHTLPGINQRSDDHPKNVAEQGLSGSSAFQKSSPAKDYKKGYYGEGKSSMAKQYGVTGAMSVAGAQRRRRAGGTRTNLGGSIF